jgi:hypothetical protein
MFHFTGILGELLFVPFVELFSNLTDEFSSYTYIYIYIYIDKSFGAIYTHKSMITWLYWLSLSPPSSVFYSMLCMNLRIIICLLRD